MANADDKFAALASTHAILRASLGKQNRKQFTAGSSLPEARVWWELGMPWWEPQTMPRGQSGRPPTPLMHKTAIWGDSNLAPDTPSA